MITTTVSTLIEKVFNDSHTEEEYKALKEELKEIRRSLDLYEYQKVNPILRDFKYTNSATYLAQIQEAFPKISWEVCKGDNCLTIERLYETSNQATIEFKCFPESGRERWYVEGSFINDLDFTLETIFYSLEEAIKYLEAALLKVKQSVEEFI